jgi:hypothetical protein
MYVFVTHATEAMSDIPRIKSGTQVVGAECQLLDVQVRLARFVES